MKTQTEHQRNIEKVLEELNANDSQKEIISRAIYELETQSKKIVLLEIKNRVQSKINTL